MKHIFIINPVAGKGNNQLKIIEMIKNKFGNLNLDYEIYITENKCDAKNYILSQCKENSPCIFYACGGDGTLHEVINAAWGYDHVNIGVIPCGSGNDFIKNFDNYIKFNDIEAQIKGESVYVDLLRVNDKYAVSVCNIGFDADAALNMHKFKKIPFITGAGCYILSVIYCLFKKLGKNLEIEIDNAKMIKGSYLLGVFANGHTYGGGYKCAPKAAINDGILDVCLVDKLSRLKIVGLIKSYKEGTHLEKEEIKKYITYLRCKNVVANCDTPINLCVDGEIYNYNKVEIRVESKAIKFWLPEGVVLQSELKSST